MFGLLQTGGVYKSQTEQLVRCTHTYLKLCYQNARDIYELTKNKNEVFSDWLKSREHMPCPPSNLEAPKKQGDRIEEKIHELHHQLVVHTTTTKLFVSFSLESFINSFATYLTNHRILISVGDNAKEVILHYISRLYDKLSTLDKWEEITKQFGAARLNKQTVLWKNFCELYSFRDNVVHDKPVFIRSTGDVLQIKKGVVRSVKPDEGDTSVVAGNLWDAYRACKTHDEMINKILQITNVSDESYHKDYYILQNSYHYKIKNLVKKLKDLEAENEDMEKGC